MLVFDLESTGLMHEQGAHLTLGVATETETGEFTVYQREELPLLARRIQASPLVSGFNIMDFDIPFLERETGISLSGVICYDPMKVIVETEGRRASLNTMLKEYWDGVAKTADGKEAITMYKQGRMAELEAYCMADVRLEAMLAIASVSVGLRMPYSKQVVKIDKTQLKEYKSQVPMNQLLGIDTQAVSTEKEVK